LSWSSWRESRIVTIQKPQSSRNRAVHL